MNEVISAILMKNPEDKIWVTYHKEPITKEKFQPVSNANEIGWVKPESGGLWCCPDYESEKWESFVSDTVSKQFMERLKVKEVFVLRPEARILSIECDEDLETAKKNLPYREFHGRIYFDFEKLANLYDGLFIRIYSEGFFKGTYYYFYGWDVSSLLLFNYDMIGKII